MPAVRFFRLAVVLMTVTLIAAGSIVEARQAQRWWKSGEIRAELDLTEAQSAAIEEIYASTVPVLESLWTVLDEEREILSGMIADMRVAEWELTLQIDKVEAARSALGKERTLMLYHMRLELTPEQRALLTEIERKRKEEHRSRC